MTIIAYRDGIIAADTAVFGNDDVYVGDIIKIEKHRNGSLVGASGGSTLCRIYKEWFHAAEIHDEFKDSEEGFTGLIIQTDSRILKIHGPHKKFTTLDAPFIAIGAGKNLATGAMAAGASAKEAVAIAIKYHGFCAGDITTLKLG